MQPGFEIVPETYVATLSPFVSTFLKEFGRPAADEGKEKEQERSSRAGRRRSKDPLVRLSEEASERGRSRQRSRSPPKDELHGSVSSLPGEREGSNVAPVQAIGPFHNDGAPAFSEWSAVPRPVDASEKTSGSRMGMSGAVKGLRDQLRASSPRLVLPSISGDDVEGRRMKIKRTKALAAATSDSGRHSAPPGKYAQAEYEPPSGIGEGYLPIDLWNNVVARKVDINPHPHFQKGTRHFNAMTRPFNRLKMRQYVSSTLKPMLGKTTPENLQVLSPLSRPIRKKPLYGAIFEEGREAASQAMRPEAPPSRLEASLLKEALDTMTNNIKNEHGEEPRHLARQAAVRGKIEQVSTYLEPELYVLDIILSELVKQENSACRERASVLETIRLRILEVFSTATLGIARACSDMDHIAEENETVAQHIAPLSQENDELKGKSEAMEFENTGLKIKAQELTETLQLLRRSYEHSQNHEDEGHSLKEKQANRMMKEANDMRDMLQSKVTILNAQVQQQDANMDVLRMQIQQLEARVRRDAERIEFMGQTVAQYKVRLAWTRVMAWAKKTKKETVDAETQDGQGLPEVCSCVYICTICTCA